MISLLILTQERVRRWWGQGRCNGLYIFQMMGRGRCDVSNQRPSLAHSTRKGRGSRQTPRLLKTISIQCAVTFPTERLKHTDGWEVTLEATAGPSEAFGPYVTNDSRGPTGVS